MLLTITATLVVLSLSMIAFRQETFCNHAGWSGWTTLYLRKELERMMKEESLLLEELQLRLDAEV